MINHDPTLPEPVEFVSAQTLRHLFNSQDYTKLAVTGQLRINVKSENHLLTPGKTVATLYAWTVCRIPWFGWPMACSSISIS